MAYFPVDGDVIFLTNTTLPVFKQPITEFVVGGSFTTVLNQPSQELLPSTNTTLGYFNGQMLAKAAGDGTGIYAGLTAGAFVNFDPASTDTGQAVWAGYVICDENLVNPLPINTTYTLGTVRVVGPKMGGVLRVAALYAGSTPALDTTVVKTALTNSNLGTFMPVASIAGLGDLTSLAFTY